MSRTGCDAVDEAAILVAIRVFQVVEKRAVRRELPFSRYGGRGLLPFPCLRSRDLHGTGIRHGSGAACPEDFQARLKAAVRAELGRRKGEMNIAGIGVIDLVVIPDIPPVRKNVPAPRCRGLERPRT